MKIYKFTQQGKRSNNEDCLGKNDALLTVCDGMGGHNYGERASAFVVEHMLQKNETLKPLSKTDIQQQLNEVQSSLNKLLETEPELEKMGTTFTGIFKTQDVWYAAHIGDSRIYVFRPKEQKLWHTWDHSLVGELMRTREITIEAGRFHPMSNRISKAIIAQKENKFASASIVKIDELKNGDILFLCSDGVVEAWGDWDLVQLFSDESLTFEQKCDKLAKQCDNTSKDNNTAIIAEIEEADAFSYGNNDELEWTTFEEVEADYRQYLKDEEQEEPEENMETLQQTDEVSDASINNSMDEEGALKKSHNSLLFWCGILALISVIAVVMFLMFKRPGKNNHAPDNMPKVETPQKVENVTTKKTSEQEESKEEGKTSTTLFEDSKPQ